MKSSGDEDEFPSLTCSAATTRSSWSRFTVSSTDWRSEPEYTTTEQSRLAGDWDGTVSPKNAVAEMTEEPGHPDVMSYCAIVEIDAEKPPNDGGVLLLDVNRRYMNCPLDWILQHQCP